MPVEVVLRRRGHTCEGWCFDTQGQTPGETNKILGDPFGTFVTPRAQSVAASSILCALGAGEYG